MTRLVGVACLLGIGAACAPCGSYELINTTAEDGYYNGTWHEECGVNFGTSGSWDLFGGDLATMDFSLDAPGDRSWDGLDVELSVSFPNALLVPGATIEPPDLLGQGALNPCIDCRQDFAGLFEGTIEVLSGWEGDDACAEEDGPSFHLAWDLTFGDPSASGPVYEAHGRDTVLFSNFLADSCGGW